MSRDQRLALDAKLQLPATVRPGTLDRRAGQHHHPLTAPPWHPARHQRAGPAAPATFTHERRPPAVLILRDGIGRSEFSVLSRTACCDSAESAAMISSPLVQAASPVLKVGQQTSVRHAVWSVVS